MKAKEFFAAMDNSELLFWWFQYGEAAQAAFYRAAPRRKAWAEIKRRGLKPLPTIRSPRPRGYETPSGYLINWGIL